MKGVREQGFAPPLDYKVKEGEGRKKAAVGQSEGATPLREAQGVRPYKSFTPPIASVSPLLRAMQVLHTRLKHRSLAVPLGKGGTWILARTKHDARDRAND